MTSTNQPVPNEQPTTLLAEIKELFGDLYEDFAHAVPNTDREVRELMTRHAVQLMAADRAAPMKIDDVACAFMWYFLMGREHHRRGFAAPLPPADFEADQDIEDFIIEVLTDMTGEQDQ
jgi:hypothetical protein